LTFPPKICGIRKGGRSLYDDSISYAVFGGTPGKGIAQEVQLHFVSGGFDHSATAQFEVRAPSGSCSLAII
jgi:hypothetical protein